MPVSSAFEGCKDSRKMVRPEATEGGELTCPAAACRGAGPQGAEQQEGHRRSRRRLHGAAVSPPRSRRSAPHARAAGSASLGPRPRARLGRPLPAPAGAAAAVALQPPPRRCLSAALCSAGASASGGSERVLHWAVGCS